MNKEYVWKVVNTIRENPGIPYEGLLQIFPNSNDLYNLLYALKSEGLIRTEEIRDRKGRGIERSKFTFIGRSRTLNEELNQILDFWKLNSERSKIKEK